LSSTFSFPNGCKPSTDKTTLTKKHIPGLNATNNIL
jgi:hypothetical protein